jgi:FG-GAP repeat
MWQRRSSLPGRVIRRSVGASLAGTALLLSGAGVGAAVAGVHSQAATCGGSVASDFNGDGHADIAVGESGALDNAGAVHVLYGTSSGLTATTPADQYFLRSDLAGGERRAGERFGWALSSGDFNQDGCDDLAIGSPRGSRVDIVFGSPAGLDLDHVQAFEQFFEPEPPLAPMVGWAVTSGDFDGDGYDDLAVGAPGDGDSRGNVFVLRGGATGLYLVAMLYRSPPPLEVRFGEELAAGDFNGDGFDELAASSDGAIEGDQPGLVTVYPGSPAGVTGAGATVWSQASPGVASSPEVEDSFGAGLAAGDFNRDGRDDLAVGVPGENDYTGVVQLLTGTATGLTGIGSKTFSQDTAGVPGIAHPGEQFGYALAAGNFNGGGGYADLAIGAPGGCFAFHQPVAGAVTALYGSSTGVRTTASQQWSQDSAGIAGTGERGDGFGEDVFAANVRSGGYSDLVVGVPYEDIAALRDVGMIHFIRGSSGGLTATGSQTWNPTTAGVLGPYHLDGYFGRLTSNPAPLRRCGVN